MHKARQGRNGMPRILRLVVHEIGAAQHRQRVEISLGAKACFDRLWLDDFGSLSLQQTVDEILNYRIKPHHRKLWPGFPRLQACWHLAQFGQGVAEGLHLAHKI